MAECPRLAHLPNRKENMTGMIRLCQGRLVSILHSATFSSATLCLLRAREARVNGKVAVALGRATLSLAVKLKQPRTRTDVCPTRSCHYCITYLLHLLLNHKVMDHFSHTRHTTHAMAQIPQILAIEVRPGRGAKLRTAKATNQA